MQVFLRRCTLGIHVGCCKGAPPAILDALVRMNRLSPSCYIFADIAVLYKLADRFEAWYIL